MKNLYRSKLLLVSVIALTVLLVALDSFMLRYSPKLFWITLPLLLLSGGIAVGKLLQIRVNEYAYYDRVDKIIDNTNHKALMSFPLPVALVNNDRRILWCNDAFGSCFFRPNDDESSIDSITTEHFSMLSGEGMEVYKNGRWYRVCSREIKYNSDDGDSSSRLIKENVANATDPVHIMFFRDITGFKSLQEEHRRSKPVVIIVAVDNYDDIAGSNRESDKTFVTVQIDRLLEEYFKDKNAVLRKMSGDKFIIVTEERFAQKMVDERIKLLELAHQIKVNDRSCVTLSIGMGRNSDSHSESESLAWQALEKAIGRGGDQAVVKSIDQEKFYGGKSVQIERNTRVKARVKAHALKELIEGKERVVVMGHSIGDVDSFGASIGIYRIAKTLNRKANVVLNEVSQSVKPIRDRFYTKEYEEDMIITGDEAKELVDENTVLVIVDVNRASYTECPELIEQAQSVVVIDHHRQAGDAIDKAVLFYIEPYASSASEMVAEISQYIGSGLKLKSAEAEAMYAGIMIDTNYFSNKTGVRTFEAMAYLRRNGADAVRIRKAFREDIDEYKIRAAAIQDTELYEGVFAIAESKSEGIESPTVFASKIANSLLDISNVKASFVLTKYRGKVYISARSIDEVNVQVMMERLGGGGHINMAGAQLENVEVEEAKNMIKQEIDSMIEEGEI